METTTTTTAFERLIDALRAGDANRVAEAISPEWLDGGARPGQPLPPEVWRTLLADVYAAFGTPDITVADLAVTGDAVSCRLTAAGVHTGNLWGLPGTGRRTVVAATLKGRLVGNRLAVAFHDATLLANLREIGVVPKPEVAHVPLVHPVSLPELVMKMVFNGGALEKPCSHLDQIKVRVPTTTVCDKCVASATAWPALRMCMTCGHVGCCDVAVNKHAIKHHQESGHALIRSINRDETWMWCYVDKTILSARK